MADIFISYSRDDTDFVRSLSESLSKAGRKVWVDWQDIPPSSPWRAEIQAAIDAASVIVFVISPGSVVSTECRREVDYAIEQGKRLVPVVLEKPAEGSAPEAIAELNWLFLTDDVSVDRLDTLLAVLDTDLAWSRAHAGLLQRAKAWQGAEQDPAKLLRGRDLLEAERWLAADTPAPRPVPLQSAFVIASRRAATSTQQRRMVLASVAAVVAIGLSIWALHERSVAEQRYLEALGRQLTIQSDTAFADADGLETSVQLALEAMRRVPTFEAYQALRAGLSLLPRTYWRSVMPTLAGVGLAFTPDGQSLVNADASWNAVDGTIALNFDHEGRSRGFAMSEDGTWVARISGSGDVGLWERASGRRLGLERSARAQFLQVVFSPDGSLLAGAHANGSVYVWATGDRRMVAELPVLEPDLSGENRDLAFSRDGRVLGVVRRKTLDRWDTRAWRRLEPVIRTSGLALRALAFGAGGHIAVAAADGGVNVYQRDGQPLHSLQADPALGSPEATAFSPDGRRLGVRGTSGSQVWDVERAVAVVFSAHGGALAFSPEGDRVAVGGANQAVSVIELSSGREVARAVHGARVYALAFRPGGEQVASAGADGVLRLWDARSGYPLAVLPGEAARFVDGGRHLLVLDDGERAEVWAVGGGDRRSVPADRRARELVVDASGTVLVGADDVPQDDPLHDVLMVWSLPSGNETTRLVHEPSIDWDAVRRREMEQRGRSRRQVLTEIGAMQQQGSVHILAVSPDGRLVVSGRVDEQARVWDSGTGELLASVPYEGSARVAFSGDGARFALASGVSIGVFESATGRSLARFDEQAVVVELVLSVDGSRLLARTTRSATLWDTDRQASLATLAPARTLHVAPDNRHAVAVDSNRAVIWSVPDGSVLAEVACRCRLGGVAWSADGGVAAIEGSDQTIRVRFVETGGDDLDLQYTGLLNGVALSADGRLLAAYGSDPTLAETPGNLGSPAVTGPGEPWLSLWTLPDGHALPLSERPAATGPPRFTADGRHLASGSEIWDLGSGRRVAAVDGEVMAFSPDQALVLARSSGTVSVFRWRAEELLRLACRQLFDSMSHTDWRAFVGDDEPYRRPCPGLD